MTPRSIHGVLGALMLWAFGSAVISEAQVTIGSVEDVVILPWGIVLSARIDTGAVQTSLAARDLKVQHKMAEFRLPEKHAVATIRLPVVAWVHIRSNKGKERRPVVEMDLCLGSQRLRSRVNLDDRTGLEYPMLVGRNTLEGNFVVDVKRSRTHPSRCPEKSPP
jgi:hypothetical protein